MFSRSQNSSMVSARSMGVITSSVPLLADRWNRQRKKGRSNARAFEPTSSFVRNWWTTYRSVALIMAPRKSRYLRWKTVKSQHVPLLVLYPPVPGGR